MEEAAVNVNMVVAGAEEMSSTLEKQPKSSLVSLTPLKIW